MRGSSFMFRSINVWSTCSSSAVFVCLFNTRYKSKRVYSNKSWMNFCPQSQFADWHRTRKLYDCSEFVQSFFVIPQMNCNNALINLRKCACTHHTHSECKGLIRDNEMWDRKGPLVLRKRERERDRQNERIEVKLGTMNWIQFNGVPLTIGMGICTRTNMQVYIHYIKCGPSEKQCIFRWTWNAKENE